jgi:hypothetical protein
MTETAVGGRYSGCLEDKTEFFKMGFDARNLSAELGG